MVHEFNDYRQPRPPLVYGFPFWTVPNFLILDYIIKLGIFLLLIPAVLGFKLTVLGLLLNFLLIDYVVYRQYRLMR